ncbi:zinc-binding dehydrogenase [Sphingomonas turrisvirgatae]|uniref:NADH oxidase n=1 Tax=Sphingomonas turrisvirgatae TaxID=1888892 RepID=A0A1E3M068_9SPHN|nr:zinc-binding dehydrogenase [Sphingomonas turrisvirgatae]ODP39411.1 NADH oxidase [Sphingomonas turrisvirgatae]
MTDSASAPTQARQLFSTVTQDGALELDLRDVPVPTPTGDQLLVRVEATPINPSDLAVLLSAADPSGFTAFGASARSPIPEAARRFTAARAGHSLPVGNEGAGTVIAAGEDPAAQALIGKTVAAAGGSFYAQYKLLRAHDCLVLPDGVSAAEGASSFVNPLTALGMVGTMRREGYRGLVHTAAASNLGQMLVKLTQAEGVPLVCIVRNQAQADLLRGLGATHVVDSTTPDFMGQLIEAIAQTQAFLAFDAIGGGKLAGQILTAMEQAALRTQPANGPYGSSQMKQVYIYGRLSTEPTEIGHNFGMKWGVGGWLLTPYLQSAGIEEVARMRARVAAEIRTTFASAYTARITLDGAIQPDTIAAYARRATGEKYLIMPNA